MNYLDWLAQQDLETCTFKEAFEAGAAVKEAEIAAIKQAICDPENQPSQFGTVTVEMFYAVSNERDQLREQVAMLRKHLSLAIIGLDESWEELNESRVELMRVAIADTEPK